MSGKLTSPLFSNLQEQVITENAVYTKKEDLFNTSLTFFCNFCFSNDSYKSIIRKLNDNLRARIGKENNLSLFKEAAALYFVGFLFKEKSKDIEKFILEKIGTLQSSGLSSNSKGLIGFCLAGTGLRSSGNVKGYLDFLRDEGTKELSRNSLETAIDFLIGASSNVSVAAKTGLKEAVMKEAGNLSVERLSKALLVLGAESDCDSLVSVLEEKISAELADWKSPEIEFSLFEALKLLNSNIPHQHLSVILRELKKVKHSWVGMIDKIEREGVFVNLSSFKRIPNFSPNNDVWALLALKTFERQYTYQVSPDDYQQFKIFKQNLGTGFTKISVSSTRCLVVFAVLLVACWFILFWGKLDLATQWKEMFQIKFDPKDLTEVTSFIFGLLKSSFAIALIFVVWIYILLERLLFKGELRFQDYLVTCPILYIPYHLLKGFWQWIKKMIKR